MGTSMATGLPNSVKFWSKPWYGNRAVFPMIFP